MIDGAEITSVIHARAENDRYGNPRRCYVVLGHGGLVLGAFDEGFLGAQAWRREVDDPPNIEPLSFRVPVRTYRDILNGKGWGR